MAITRTQIDVDTPEGYEAEGSRNVVAPDVRGVFLQNDISNDEDVLIERDALNNLVFKDPVLGTTKTLSQLAASAGVSTYDFLLDCEPVSEDVGWVVTRTSGRVSAESWTLVSTSQLIKTIDYTRTAGRVTTEVRKIYAPDGSTVVAQLTVVYTRTAGHVVSAAMTRDI